jgi:hypothetical protein
MKASHAYRGVFAGVVFTAWASLSPAWAQQTDEGTTLLRSPRAYRYLAQARAADELVKQLGPTAKDLNTLFQLSRLLSEPCDQVRWLVEQIEPSEFATDAQTRSSAEDLLARVTDLEQALGPALRGCPEQVAALKQLLTRIAEPPTPWELTDPAQLAQRWHELRGLQNAELARELTPERRLTLFARGIPPTELGLDARAAWDQPRRIVDALAASEQLPETWRLLQLQQALDAAERNSAAWAELAFPVRDTFGIAQGLLDRALGIDAQDRGSATGEPDWVALTERLETRDCWAWATLARILEAASQPDPATATADARTQWDRVARVGGGTLWPAVGSPSGWLARLEQGELAGPGLALAPAYRSAQRAARRRFEQQFPQARGNPGDALRLIQLAKAADIGLTEDRFQPITLAGLEEWTFSTPRRAPRIFALLEIIEIHAASGQSSQYYAFRLNVRGWQWDSGAVDSEVVGPADSPAALVRTALDPAGNVGGMRLLIAPDGPLDDDWFAFERTYLLERTSGSTAWLCYTPSAASVAGPAWTLEQSLRYWCRTAANTSARMLSCYPDGQTPRDIPQKLHLAPPLPLYAVSIGPLPDEIGRLRLRTFVEDFRNAKQAASVADRTLPVMLVFTAQQP